MAKNNDVASVLAFEKNWFHQMAIFTVHVGIINRNFHHCRYRKNLYEGRFQTA